MNLLQSIFTPATLSLTALAVTLSARADVTDLPVKYVDGRSCYYYEVKPKETIYSLTRELKVTKEDIFRFNPSASDGLKAGQVLLFPVDAIASYTPAKGDFTGPRTHTVEKGETMFGISRKYGITTDDIMAWNPATAQGLKSGMVLYVSNPDASATAARQIEEPQPADGSRYVIQRGETLYQIAHRNNITVESLLAANPGLDSGHYSAGQTISIPRPGQVQTALPAPQTANGQNPASAPQSAPQATVNAQTYLVKEGETLYSISRANGLTVEQIEQANPGLGILQGGMVILLPVAGSQNAVSTATPAVASTPTLPYDSPAIGGGVPLPAPDYTTVNQEQQTTPVNIAVALPFMTTADSRPKSAQLFTEFYRGFMLAVDSVRNEGRPVYIYAYDTGDNLDTVRNLLSRPEMKDMSVIIAPDDEDQLREFAFFGRTNNVPVINTFVVKDNSFRYNPAVMQCNIPHRDMYSKAIKEMTREFIGATPVILNSQDGSDDKSEYITHMRQQLDSMGIRYITIDYKGRLSQNDLKSLTSGHSYVFIPTSGKQAEFSKIAPALIEMKEQSADPDAVRVFGYPEWVTFRGESLKQLHKLNTSIYSRFYTDPDDRRVTAVENKYKHWYGESMGNYLPSQGLLGFDLGLFVINSLRAPSVALDSPGVAATNSGMKMYDGVQNGFHIIRLDNAGSMNDLLYIVNFRPSGNIERRTI